MVVILLEDTLGHCLKQLVSQLFSYQPNKEHGVGEFFKGRGPPSEELFAEWVVMGISMLRSPTSSSNDICTSNLLNYAQP